MTMVFVIAEALDDDVLAVFSSAEGAAAEVERIVAEDAEREARDFWDYWQNRRQLDGPWEDFLARWQEATKNNLYVVELELDAKTVRS